MSSVQLLVFKEELVHYPGPLPSQIFSEILIFQVSEKAEGADQVLWRDALNEHRANVHESLEVVGIDEVPRNQLEKAHARTPLVRVLQNVEVFAKGMTDGKAVRNAAFRSGGVLRGVPVVKCRIHDFCGITCAQGVVCGAGQKSASRNGIDP